jgi:hypothetical protein
MHGDRLRRSAVAGGGVLLVARSGPGDGSDTLSDSGPVANGAAYSFTFTRPGHHLSHCTRHGFRVMHGTVTVVDRGPRSAPTPARPFGIPLPQLPPSPNLYRSAPSPR